MGWSDSWRTGEEVRAAIDFYIDKGPGDPAAEELAPAEMREQILPNGEVASEVSMARGIRAGFRWRDDCGRFEVINGLIKWAGAAGGLVE
jgi:hypothetical protein